jgi:hypothetical protein
MKLGAVGSSRKEPRLNATSEPAARPRIIEDAMLGLGEAERPSSATAAIPTTAPKKRT